MSRSQKLAFMSICRVSTEIGPSISFAAEIPQALPQSVRQSVVHDDIVSAGVGATEIMEIGIRVAVESPRALQVSVADQARSRRQPDVSKRDTELNSAGNPGAGRT